MTVLRIVALDSDKFAVQRRYGFFRWHWLGRKDNYVWYRQETILQWCLMDTVEEAEESLQFIIKDINMRKRSLPRIVKVIKTVRV